MEGCSVSDVQADHTARPEQVISRHLCSLPTNDHSYALKIFARFAAGAAGEIISIHHVNVCQPALWQELGCAAVCACSMDRFWMDFFWRVEEQSG